MVCCDMTLGAGRLEATLPVEQRAAERAASVASQGREQEGRAQGTAGGSGSQRTGGQHQTGTRRGSERHR
eukprot:11897696-Heterocapsa_arctica.AAC.1